MQALLKYIYPGKQLKQFVELVHVKQGVTQFEQTKAKIFT